LAGRGMTWLAKGGNNGLASFYPGVTIVRG